MQEEPKGLSISKMKIQKERLLDERKALISDLEYAENEFDAALIEKKREALAKKIKDLHSKIEDAESSKDS